MLLHGEALVPRIPFCGGVGARLQLGVTNCPPPRARWRGTFGEVLVSLETMFPCVTMFGSDPSIREEIAKLQSLPDKSTMSNVNELWGRIDYDVGCLSPGSYGIDKLLLWLVRKIPKALWSECRATEERRTRMHTYAGLALLLTEHALDCQ